MKISQEKPPCYDAANELFKLEELNMGTIFTYGDTLYNPSNVVLTQDLLVHEEIHSHQQENNDTVAKLWWQRYVTDPAFRVEQEAAAYGAQWVYLCRQSRDRNKRAQILHTLAGQFASPMYGRTVTHTTAMRLIREHAKIA